MNDLETKLKNILKKLKKPKISLQEANDLYFEAKKLGFQAKKEEITKKVFKLAANGAGLTYQIGRNYFVEWISGEVEPTDHELNLLDKMADELLDIIPKFSPNEIEPGILAYYKNFNQFVSEVTANLHMAKSLVGIEKSRRRKKTPSQKANEKNENNSTTEMLQQQINILTQLLTSFQAQIQELEKNFASNNSSPQLKSQLNNLKSQQQKVQSQLVEKQKQVKTINESNQNQLKETSSTSDKFNWLWVVIPTGGGNNFIVRNSYFPVSEKESKQIEIYDERK